MSYPLPLTRTEAYLAYKAGVIQQSELKPSLAVPRIGIDAWLAYWTQLANDYPKNPDGTPMILQEEEAYIAYLCGVINEYPEKCLRRVGAYLRYIISARWGRPDHPLNREELYLSLIKTQFIPSGDPSSDIVIDGTTKAPFVVVKLYGDTFQQSYEGKNLLNIAFRDDVAQGITATQNSDGTITFRGVCTSNFSNVSTRQPVSLPAGTYTISTTTSHPNFGVVLRLYKEESGGTNIGDFQVPKGGTPRTFTISSDVKSGYIWLSGTSEGLEIDETIGIQLEVGSTATSFEPFVGGTPSPSPGFPQPVQTVTGAQTVTINGTDYPLDLGAIELAKLDTYQDYIWKDGEDWKLHKATKRLTFDASEDESWIKSGQSTSSVFIGALTNLRSGDFLTTSDNGALSKMPNFHFSTEKADGVFRFNKNAGSAYMDYLFLEFDTAKISTIDGFKDWLESNPSTLYAPMATPTDTVIADQNLINQLEALVKGGSEEGTTYIKVSATEPNLPGLLYAEAAKYV